MTDTCPLENELPTSMPSRWATLSGCSELGQDRSFQQLPATCWTWEEGFGAGQS